MKKNKKLEKKSERKSAKTYRVFIVKIKKC